MRLFLNELQKFNAVAAKIVPKKSVMPILEYALIENGYLRITNIEIGARIPIVDNGLNCVVSYKILSDILKSKPEYLDIDIEDDDKSKIVFKFNGHSLREIITRTPDDYPAWPQYKNSFSLGQWDAEMLAVLLKTTAFCSTDELKPALTGVRFVQSKGSIDIVGTDGHRLRLYELKTNSTNDFTGTIPVDIIKIINSMKSDAMVTLTTNPDSVDHLSIKVDDIEFSVRMIDDATYPNYREVIPTEYGEDWGKLHGDVVFNRKAMINALKAAVLLKATNDTTFQIAVTPSSGSLTINAVNMELQREFNTSIPNSLNTLPETDRQTPIGLNAQYLTNILEAHDSDEIKWQVSCPTSAQMFPGENYTDLLMPIRLRE